LSSSCYYPCFCHSPVPVPAFVLVSAFVTVTVRTALHLSLHCKKKVSGFSRPQPGCHLPNSPWAGIIKFFPARKSMVSDIPAGDGKTDNLFLQCKLPLVCSKFLCFHVVIRSVFPVTPFFYHFSYPFTHLFREASLSVLHILTFGNIILNLYLYSYLRRVCWLSSVQCSLFSP
jgi:hypothetical protein